MPESVKFSLRLKQDTYALLEKLLEDDEEEARRTNRPAMSRPQMIDRCVREYYAVRHNGEMQNAYLEMVENVLLPMLQQAVKRIVNEISESRNLLESTVEEYGICLRLMSKLILLAPNFADDEKMAEYYLEKDAAFERIIESEKEKIMEEKGTGK